MATKVRESHQNTQANGEKQRPLTPYEDDDNLFPYGWRVVPVTQPDGQIDYDWVPLTQADFLDP